jgi:hypothetical protein
LTSTRMGIGSGADMALADSYGFAAPCRARRRTDNGGTGY